MQPFRVTQYLSNYDEIRYAAASVPGAVPLENFQNSYRYEEVTVMAENEYEAIALVHSQQLLPVIPESVINLIQRLWNVDKVYPLYYATSDLQSVIPAAKNLTDFIKVTINSVVSDIIDSIEYPDNN